jgi:uncharacterized membrane protein YtjA (UPF0391 family)
VRTACAARRRATGTSEVSVAADAIAGGARARLGRRHVECNAVPRRGGFVLPSRKEGTMLHWAVIFFVVALIAAVFGFGGIAAGAAGIGKILFVAFLLMAVISLVANFARGA